MNLRWRMILGCLLVVVLVVTATGNIKSENTAIDSIQRNSLNMLNNLAVLTQGINASKNSRVYLEEVYSSLINNIHPNAVDENTHMHLASILDTLETYRMISVNRSRLQYIYDQNRAMALKNTLPHPLGLLSLVESRSIMKSITSVLYIAMDVLSSYTAFNAELDLEHLQGNWELDDEASAVLHEIRKQTFSYMVATVNNYGLPGSLALNEKAVDEFVQWKNNTNKVQRLMFLENNQATYQAFGAYWITLAETYYENEAYDKALEAIAQYESLQSQMFRKDYLLAQVMPTAIVAANERMNDADYVVFAEQSLNKILMNTDNSDWALRFFAAQTFMELYVKTNEARYLQKAYDITLSNVNHLSNEQRKLNREYASKLMETQVPKGATKETKAEIDQYNKQSKAGRKTALPPVYEPFYLNAELLFFLANQLDIPDTEKIKIEGILHENNEDIVLVPAIDALFRFFKTDGMEQTGSMEVAYTGKELSLPVKTVTSNPVIKVTVTDAETQDQTEFTDWQIDRVDRKKEGDLNSFMAVFKSNAAEQHQFTADSVVNIEVFPRAESEAKPVNFSFKAIANKTQWWEQVKIWEGDVVFEQVIEEQQNP